MPNENVYITGDAITEFQHGRTVRVIPKMAITADDRRDKIDFAEHMNDIFIGGAGAALKATLENADAGKIKMEIQNVSS